MPGASPPTAFVIKQNDGAFMKFDAFKKLFPEDKWDVGFLSIENLKRCAFSPLKAIYHGGAKPCLKIANEVDYDCMFYNALVLVRKTEITLDYSLNEEAEAILEANGFKYQQHYIEIYTNFKLAAILSGLGVRGKNSLVHSHKFGFDCKICCYGFEETITDAPNIAPDLGFLDACANCDDCRKRCPAGAIHNDKEPYWLDSTNCNGFILMSYHDKIPSVKKFWHKYVHPELGLDAVKSVKKCDQLLWNANGYCISTDPANRGQNPYKDGKPIYVPVCRECQIQPRCSKWNGVYPYEL
jgi:ferredoxin